HAVKPIYFAEIAMLCVCELFGIIDEPWGIVFEMPGLTRHRPKISHLPEQPLFDLNAPALVAGIELAALAPEILKNGARLEDRDRLAAWAIGIDDCGHAIVRADAHEARLELFACADVHRL